MKYAKNKPIRYQFHSCCYCYSGSPGSNPGRVSKHNWGYLHPTDDQQQLWNRFWIGLFFAFFIENDILNRLIRRCMLLTLTRPQLLSWLFNRVYLIRYSWYSTGRFSIQLDISTLNEVGMTIWGKPFLASSLKRKSSKYFFLKSNIIKELQRKLAWQTWSPPI